MAKPRQKTLSICIPTYNRPECMRESLQNYLGVLMQHRLLGEVEICISDNSPSRETERVVKEFSKKLCIRYFRNKKNLRYDKNVILALSLASGKFIQLVGDELSYSGSAMEAAVGIMKRNACDAALFDDDRLFPASTAPTMKSGREVWGKALSYKWVLNRSITHIDYVAIRRQDFLDYLEMLGTRVEGFYGLIFIQLSFYFFALKRCKRVCVLDRVNAPRGQSIPKKVGVYFPSDDARVFYCKYFQVFRECRETGILTDADYGKFKRGFALSAANHLLRIRTHMHPRIYSQEIAEVQKNITLVEREYPIGLCRAWLFLLRKILFIRAIPYHWLYQAFDIFRSRVLGKPRASALELYDMCLDGKKMEKSSLQKTDF